MLSHFRVISLPRLSSCRSQKIQIRLDMPTIVFPWYLAVSSFLYHWMSISFELDPVLRRPRTTHSSQHALEPLPASHTLVRQWYTRTHETLKSTTSLFEVASDDLVKANEGTQSANETNQNDFLLHVYLYWSVCILGAHTSCGCQSCASSRTSLCGDQKWRA